ncbi:MAG TPA: DUF222 domain-containing protein [Mycobacterium sp.]|nr:DUF222 domain-containing protein [Mycobacterium sp.]
MFETIDDAGLIAAIADSVRAEAAEAARRSALIGELVARRVVDHDDDPRVKWAFDPWASVAAEVAAAMNISDRKASGQMRIAEILRDHLPSVFALFARGRLSGRVIAAITWRTRLIVDDEVWAQIDAALAERAQRFGPLSDEKLTVAVDDLVQRFDRGALIDAQKRARTRDFKVGDFSDEAGLTSVWGKLLAHDAEVLDKRVSAMVAGVCDADPRSQEERRSDAVGAIANGNEHLPCACGSPTCPANMQNPTPKSSVVVSVVADQAAIDAAKTATKTPATAPSDRGTAILSGTEMLPTPVLAELLRSGARLQPLIPPREEPEAGYRPSAKLARFVRARDLTCRFPGCSVPSEFCDIDHVVPYPIGPTHPSNLACLCRKHHLLKTFWTGDWALALLADGTAIWTSPTGHKYTTQPGCRIFFPDWDTTTAELPPPPSSPSEGTDRGVKMPLRKRSRAKERQQRVRHERAQNANSELVQNDSDPPPF